MAWPDFSYDIYENFEDATLEAGLTLVDAGGKGDLDSTAQYKVGTHSFEHDWSQPTGDPATRVELAIDHDFSCGFWYRSGLVTGGGTLQDAFGLRGGSGGWTNLIDMADEYNWSSERCLYDEACSSGNKIIIEDETWYWITVSWVVGVGGKVRVYDESHSLVGSEQSFTANSGDSPAVFRLGEGYQYSNLSTKSYYDAFVVDHTDATFPLLGWEEGIAFKARIIGGAPVLCLKGVSL